MELFAPQPVESSQSAQGQMREETKEGVDLMLNYAVVFLLVAVVAGLFGFGGIASASAGIAQILFFIFLVLFVVTLVARAVRS